MDKKSNHAAELYEFHGDLLLFYDTLTVIADGLSYKFPDDPCGYSAITVSLDYYKERLDRLEKIITCMSKKNKS
ncbi:MAG: hypothetical protein IJT80_02060 [Lachnospiraceae bacterium]|nr:hypothetical protein [Lachnospiraceae bacterium]